jgi:hypothetical protein
MGVPYPPSAFCTISGVVLPVPLFTDSARFADTVILSRYTHLASQAEPVSRLYQPNRTSGHFARNPQY